MVDNRCVISNEDNGYTLAASSRGAWPSQVGSTRCAYPLGMARLSRPWSTNGRLKCQDNASTNGHPYRYRPRSTLSKSQIPLRYPTSELALHGLRPASELDSVMEFGLSRTIQLASSSRVCRRPAANRSATRFELSRHVEIARTCVRHIGNQLANQLASWSATC